MNCSHTLVLSHALAPEPPRWNFHYLIFVSLLSLFSIRARRKKRRSVLYYLFQCVICEVFVLRLQNFKVDISYILNFVYSVSNFYNSLELIKWIETMKRATWSTDKENFLLSKQNQRWCWRKELHTKAWILHFLIWKSHNKLSFPRAEHTILNLIILSFTSYTSVPSRIPTNFFKNDHGNIAVLKANSCAKTKWRMLLSPSFNKTGK